MQLIIFILGFLLFVGLIIIHEWGHYFAAKKNGVVVEEFGLGLPPRAWGKKNKDGMMLSLNWLPIGGFVKLKGEHDADITPGSYGAASLLAKTKIMLAGVTMNLIAGLVLLSLLALWGMPRLIDNQFTIKSDTKIIRSEIRAGYIDDGSPAQKIGLQSKDNIKKIVSAYHCVGNTCTSDTKLISSAADLKAATRAYAGERVRITFLRAGKEQTSDLVSLRSVTEVDASKKTNNPKGYLGVIPTELIVQRSTWSAPIVALGFTKQLTVLTIQGLGSFAKGIGSTIAGVLTVNKQARQNGQTQATAQVGGPIAIMVVIWESGTLGISFMLLVIAVVSLTLAIMNALPIPALDGGRLFVTIIYRLLRRPLTKAAEERIHYSGMVALLALFAIITVVDVKRFF